MLSLLKFKVNSSNQLIKKLQRGFRKKVNTEYHA